MTHFFLLTVNPDIESCFKTLCRLSSCSFYDFP